MFIYPKPINLQLFAEPATEFDLDVEEEEIEEEEEEEEVEGETEEEKTKRIADKQKDWFVPGVAETKEGLLKQRKREKQYMKQLEAKNKALQDQVTKAPVTDAPPVTEQTGDKYDQAIKELGIEADDFITKPLETNKKILQYIDTKMIPSGVQGIAGATGDIRAQILKDKVKEVYPDFDIDGQEDKVARILTDKYNDKHIKSHSLQLILGIVKELGGKKGGKSSGIPHTEEPTTGTALTKANKSRDDAIRKSIREAKIGTADITQI